MTKPADPRRLGRVSWTDKQPRLGRANGLCVGVRKELGAEWRLGSVLWTDERGSEASE